jgi:hypothetical protein
LRHKCGGLDVVKGRHKISGNLCRFLVGYGVGRMLFTSLKEVFQCAAPSRAGMKRTLKLPKSC